MSEGFPVLDEEQLRRELVQVSRAVHARGWVANHDGNISARLSGGRLLCTPTAVSKGDMEPEWLIVVDSEGKVISGNRRSFSELRLHRVAYRARPDIGVVLHAHPPITTGFAVSGAELGHPFMPEPVASLGAVIPVVPYHPTGSEELDQALASALGQADVAILEHHGAISVGGSLEQAWLRMELLEHLAQISLAAARLGGTRRLPEAHIAALSKKGRPRSVPDFSGGTKAQKSSEPVRAHAGRPDLGALVQDALKRLG